MADYSALQEERDDDLVTEAWSACRNLSRGFREWIQSELKDSLYRLECIEPTLPAVLRAQANAEIRRMRDIDQTELPEAIRNIDQKISEIRDGAYDNVRDARIFLEEGMSRFDMMVTDLMRIRRFLQSFDDDDLPSEDVVDTSPEA